METPIIEQQPEKIYRYQPTDESGRPLGGVQVIKYTTHEELADKLRDQSVLLLRKLRSETRKNRLGIVEDETISEDAQRFAGPVEFKPKELTSEERYEISRKLIDPTTVFEATSQLFEAAFGASPAVFGQTLQNVQQDNFTLKAKIEADAFAEEEHRFYKCPENAEAITAWIARYGLAPTKQNFHEAFNKLNEQGVLIQAPDVAPIQTVSVEETRQPLPVVEPQPVIVPPVVPRIGSGLTREIASDTGTSPQPGSDIVYDLVSNGHTTRLTGLQAVRAMSGDEYKRRLLTDKDFGKKVDALEAGAKQPRA
jgi:hypothetical protein